MATLVTREELEIRLEHLLLSRTDGRERWYVMEEILELLDRYTEGVLHEAATKIRTEMFGGITVEAAANKIDPECQ